MRYYFLLLISLLLFHLDVSIHVNYSCPFHLDVSIYLAY